MPHAALIHDNFTGPTGMGLVVGSHARWLLDAGWDVTLIGDNVPRELADSCSVVPAVAPRGLPSLAEHVRWCTRARQALRDVTADLVHVHSPLLAAEADVVTSHHLAYAAHARGTREMGSGLHGALRRLQAHANRWLDHAAYKRQARRTHISFVSEFLRDEFTAWYGKPLGGWILTPPAPAWNPVSPEERAAARASLGVPTGSICVGYLGGADLRKGWQHLTELAGIASVTLLVAGPGSERLAIDGRPGLGFVDVDAFHAACDVVAAPTVFDAAPVAVLQAIARDVPVVTTPQSGWAPALAREGAGVVWDRTRPIAAALRAAVKGTSSSGRFRFVKEFGAINQARNLLQAYAEILGESPVSESRSPVLATRA